MALASPATPLRVTIPDSPPTAAVLPLLTLRILDTPAQLGLIVRFFALRTRRQNTRLDTLARKKQYPDSFVLHLVGYIFASTSGFSHRALGLVAVLLTVTYSNFDATLLG